MILTVKNLHSSYGRIPILNGITFDVEEGQFVGILGHNGMGKTTLMKTLMGFIRANHGSVTFDARDVTHAPPEQRSRHGMGYVPQGREIFPALSVSENLQMGCATAPARVCRDTVDEVLTEFPRLKRLLDRTGGALSGGEQQLLALARCLCARPRLLLLDEPTEGIQPSINEEIIETLLRLREKGNLTMILVEQKLDFITALSQRILVLQKGQITREASPEELSHSSALDEFAGL